ncbi:MAG TPA: cell surface protein SprA, partial [Chitinophagales bacterium]|nr:cell surface protein SprA [Chitinophagales bacterium]
GLPKDGSTDALDQTNWGNVPRTPPITTAFDNDVESRANQDKGYDGLNSDEEADFYNQFMLDAPTYVSGAALVKLESDPSTDDYHYYRGGDYDDAELSILERYKKYNNPQGNSPTTESSPEAYPTAATTIPESEDLNDDYTLNETESYFQYRIKLEPGMESINPYITDVVVAEHTFQDGSSDSIKWYQFKVPIDQFDGKVGSIQDFKSIRFMRMFMTGFTDDVVLRFARLELVRNQWRRYQFSMLNPGEYIGNDDGNETDFNVSSVSIEENSARQPIPYALPPGISREQTLGSGSSVSTYQQNEQSLSMQICPLQDGDARAIFKSLNIDLRRYGRLTMNVHAEPLPDAPLTTLNDGDLHIFIRLGSDFTNNYYEYDLPLTVTKLPLPAGTTEDEAVREAIWATLIDFPLDSLVQVKTLRNKNEVSPLVPFSITSGTDQGTYTIIGNPDLGYVEEIMIGVRNPKDIGGSGAEFCSEVWVNELRLSNIDESGGWAALARADVKLADLGNFTLSGNLHTAGFGTLEQQIDERYK